MGENDVELTTHSVHLDAASLARVKGLSLRARAVVDGVLQGVHKSPHHGISIEFSEHKEYTPGDELRHIDWRAAGRLDKLFVKRFEQETHTRAYFVIDTSGSMGYAGSDRLSKFDYCGVLAVSLGYLLLGQQDAVGLVTCADKVTAVLPPRARSSHLMQMCEVLAKQRPDGGTSLVEALAALNETARKRSLIFLFSDFFSKDHPDAFGALRRMVSRGHQVTAFHVLDGDELTFPFEGMAMFEGMEKRHRLLAEPRLIRQRYLARLNAHMDGVRKRCSEAQVAYTLVDTSQAPGVVLSRYLASQSAPRS